jgi:hypothetical protein
VVPPDAGVHLPEIDAVAARFEQRVQRYRRERRLNQRAHVWPERFPGRTRLHNVRAALGKNLLPEDHMPDEAVLLLHGEEAAQVALGEIELAQAREDHDVKAGVPEPLEGIGLERWRDIAVVLAEEARITVLDVA